MNPAKKHLCLAPLKVEVGTFSILMNPAKQHLCLDGESYRSSYTGHG